VIVQSEPAVLDPSGQDIPTERVRLRAQGPITRVELPAGVRGAGSETTTNPLRKAMLPSHPEQYQLVLDGQVSWPAVIEETLPVASPIAPDQEDLSLGYGARHRLGGGLRVTRKGSKHIPHSHMSPRPL
jgi:hypothetical protein